MIYFPRITGHSVSAGKEIGMKFYEAVFRNVRIKNKLLPKFYNSKLYLRTKIHEMKHFYQFYQ